MNLASYIEAHFKFTNTEILEHIYIYSLTITTVFLKKILHTHNSLVEVIQHIERVEMNLYTIVLTKNAN